MTHPPLPFLPFLLLLLLLPLVPAEDVCAPKPRETRCLPTLATQPDLYAACRTQPCYLFISEPPFIRVPDPPPPPPHRPFPCRSPAPYSGVSFDVHAFTPPALCVYAGPDCSFTDLVHFTGSFREYQFAITGLLMETPERLCNHSAASPFLEDAMVIMGHDERTKRVEQLVRPFSILTWVVLMACLALIAFVAFSIAFVSRGKPSLVTAVFVATGDSSAVLRKAPIPVDREQHKQLTKYSLSITLLKIAVAMLVTLLALFYEAGVVNFLFQQNTAELGKRVRTLSAEELSEYSILKDSALEQVWDSFVNPDGFLYDPETEEPPWARCRSGEQCASWLIDPDHPVRFVVNFNIGARFVMQQLSACDTLTVFETNDIPFRFTGGWLYNNAVPKTFRQHVDRVLVGLRINRTLGRLFQDNFISDACEESEDQQLGPGLVAMPIGIVVLPPLLLSVLILFFKKDEKSVRNRSGSDPPTGQDTSSGLDPNNVSTDLNNDSTDLNTVSPDLHIVSADPNNVSTDLSLIPGTDTARRTSTLELEEIGIS